MRLNSIGGWAFRLVQLGTTKILIGGWLSLVRRSTFSAWRFEQHVKSARKPFFGIRRPAKRRSSIALHEGRYILPHFAPATDVSPPPTEVVFVSVCNDKYAPGLEALILSLHRVYPGFSNRYLVYHDGSLSPLSRQRLAGLHSGFEFNKRDPSSYPVALGSFENHQRIGLLGYLSLEALKLREPPYVVILDTDLLVLGDISALWQGDRIRAVPDIGARPFGVVSSVTKLPVINSGVLSLPRSARDLDAWPRASRILETLHQHPDRDIERFADQRFWNIFAAERGVDLLPQNYNAIKTLVTHYFPDQLALVSVLHLTGPKPWYSFINRELLGKNEMLSYQYAASRFPGAFALWDSIYKPDLLLVRLAAFNQDCGADLFATANRLGNKPVALIGNGPSINETDLNAFAGYEKIVFNWFINHDQFDTVCPDHLVIASHMIFGGWGTTRPELPTAFLDTLTRHSHKPRLWFSYYFRPYVESLPQLEGYKKSYFFLEKPFKQFIARSGIPQFDLHQPLVDCNTGVLTAGVPLAVHIGARTIVLAGCDANYRSTAGSYFYNAEKHQSRTTSPHTLLHTWGAGGKGQFGYSVTQRALAERGIGFFDATINGHISDMPQLTLEQVKTRR
jgi:hypothetical protein